MIPFDRIDSAFSALPEKPVNFADEDKEHVKKVTAVNTMRLWFNGN